MTRVLLALVVLTGCEDPFFEVYDAGVALDGALEQPRCATLRQLEPFPLSTSTVAAAASLDESNVLVIDSAPLDQSENALFYRVDRAGAHRLPLVIDRFVIRAATSLPETGVWISGGRGAYVSEIRFGWPEEGFQTVLPDRPAPTRQAWARWLDAAFAPDGEPVLFALSDIGSLDRFMDGQWETLFDAPDNYLGRGEIAAAGWDEVYWLGKEMRKVYGYARGIVKIELEQFRPDPPFHTVEVLENNEAVVGVADGTIRWRQKGMWKNLGLAPTDMNALAIAPLRDGFLYAGRRNLIHQYFPEIAFCEAQSGPALIVTHIVAMQQAFLFAGFPQPPAPADAFSVSIVTWELSRSD